MTQQSPRKAGSAGTVGNRPSEHNSLDRLQDLEICERLAAIVDELKVTDADVDVPLTLARGLLEDIEAAL